MKLFPTTDEQFEIPNWVTATTEMLRAYDSGGIDAVRPMMVSRDNEQVLRTYLDRIAGSSREWAGGISRQRAIDLYSNPDPSLVSLVEDARSLISEEITPPQTVRRRTRRGVEFGEMIDSDRYLARVAECWDRSERMVSPIRTLRLGVNLATSSNRSQSSIVWRGATTVAAIDELTRRGYGVELVAFQRLRGLFVDSPARYTTCGFVAKRASEPVDLAYLSTLCCSIACYRHHVIPSMAVWGLRRVDQFYGTPVDATPKSVGCDAIFDQSIASRAMAVDAIQRIVEGLDESVSA
jgi:hypothetical protein